MLQQRVCWRGHALQGRVACQCLEAGGRQAQQLFVGGQGFATVAAVFVQVGQVHPGRHVARVQRQRGAPFRFGFGAGTQVVGVDHPAVEMNLFGLTHAALQSLVVGLERR